jgi:vancomycin resistance protein YoaR
MGVSSSNRIHNVHLLGQYLDGTIVRPGGKFSFNEVMGPRTPERGFLEGQAIVGGVLVPSIGGGVCQTATTIFNAAFEEGLPVLERHNHSFYISHYPTGRDATVYWGVIDFVFRNDLDHAILIKASWTNETFTVTFYGTDQGRKVVATTSEPTNWAQPSLQYAVDPNAPPGSVRTTAAGGSGFDVNVHRKIYEDGELIRQDDFFTRYTPQHPVRVYGPGTTPPGPYTVIPSSA